MAPPSQSLAGHRGDARHRLGLGGNSHGRGHLHGDRQGPVTRLTVGSMRSESPGVPQSRGAASLRRQQFPWKPPAVQRPRMWKMPVGKEANGRSQPAEGRPSEQRRWQVAHRQPEEAPQGSPSQASSRHGITLPRVPYPERFQPVITQHAQMRRLGHRVVLPSTRVLRREQTPHLSSLVTMAPQQPPWSGITVGSSYRLPPVTPAASAASGNVSISSVGSASSDQWQLLKTAAQLHHVPSYSSRDAWSKASAPTAESSVLHRYCTGSQGPCQQPVAWQDSAHSWAAETQATACTVCAANSKASATQYTLRSTGRAAEHLPAAGSKGSFKSKLPVVQQQVFPHHLPPLPHIKTSQQRKTSALPRAPEKHRAPLPPIAPARGSCHSSKQEAAAQGQRQAPALQPTKATDAALESTAMSKERKSLALPVAAVPETTKRPVEQKDTTKSLHLEIVVTLPTAVGSLLAAKPQGGHHRIIASQTVHEGDDAASHREIPGTEADTLHLAPGPDKGRDAAPSSPAQVSQHLITKTHVAGIFDPELQEAGRFVVLPMTEPLKEEEEVGTEEEKKEHEWEGDRREEVLQLEDVLDCNIGVKALVQEDSVFTVKDITVNASVPELPQAPSMGSQEGSICPSSVGTDAAGEAATDEERVSAALAHPVDTKLAALIPAGAVEEEQHCTSSAPVLEGHEEEATNAIVFPGADKGEVADSHREIPGAEAETPHLAPGPHKEGDAAASSPAQVSQHLITKAHVAGTRDPELQEAGDSVELQEGSSCPSSVGMHVAGKAAEHLQSVSPAGAQDSRDEPGTSLSQVAPKLGRQQRAHEFGHTLASSSLAKPESLQWKFPGRSPLWWVAGEPCLGPVQPHTYSSPFPTSIATLPDTGAAQQRRPSRFRRALKALRRAFRCSCISAKVEE